jgi:hypothetical protein
MVAPSAGLKGLEAAPEIAHIDGVALNLDGRIDDR